MENTRAANLQGWPSWLGPGRLPTLGRFALVFSRARVCGLRSTSRTWADWNNFLGRHPPLSLQEPRSLSDLRARPDREEMSRL